MLLFTARLLLQQDNGNPYPKARVLMLNKQLASKSKLMKKKILAAATLLIVVLQADAQISANKNRLQKKVVCRHGAVVSANAFASQAGLQVLKEGGNAFDAAITTQLVLAVVYPGAGNIGGGGFLVGHLSSGKNISIDFREVAPGKASRDMYLDSVGRAQPNLSQNGRTSVAVPGSVAGIFASLKYARLPFKKLIQPAIDFAEKGFPLSKIQADELNQYQHEFIANNSAAVAFVKFVPWKEGDLLVQLNLAETLKRIRDQGAKGFYEGETARLLVEEMQKAGGLISYEDLKNYRAKERPVMSFDYRGYRIISMPLPSSGGILLQQMLGMVSGKKMASLKFQSAAAMQLMIEAERRAYADRAEYLGDNDFVKVPLKTLLSKQYLNERMSSYTPGKAGSSAQTGAGNFPESEETTHIDVVDAAGNAVSVTTTLNGTFGSRIVVSGAGFLLNNEMDDFSSKPGAPNMYGATGNDKNAIAPGKRMLSSMAPTIVLKNNAPFLVLGTPGGTTIPTSVFQAIVNVIDFRMSASEAINQPKFHHQWLPDEVYVENDFDEAGINALKGLGYKVVKRGSIGRTEIIHIQNGTITAVGDRRGEDAAAGY